MGRDSYSETLESSLPHCCCRMTPGPSLAFTNVSWLESMCAGGEGQGCVRVVLKALKLVKL